MYDQLVSSGYSDMLGKDEFKPVWFQVDVIVQEIPEKDAITMSIIVMMAYPAKLANMYIAVYTQLMSVGVEAVDEPVMYQVIVDDIKRDTGDWAKTIGPFLEFLPNSGIEWYQQQGDLDPDPTS
jgi:hypothetical protein